ncbi:hypothetical protein [Chryseobacterium jejuense]|uniref:MORN repeat variant n=1 Tax=Chryseobacterium jejuense TaxID=445960 RepID=A0A2X2WX19_CHRJE|nr:hypothetical protein [Chryseobacterium jejuense]SDJ32184.1 hypothetical protein SAMN05421542_3179 [Chryseobacterium jejuense]SQB45376.1 Uncharacterised protein [Chryseobacterium jejuense]
MMNIQSFFLFFAIIISCNWAKANSNFANTIISKTYVKERSHDTDTLKVYQNDTAVFRKEEMIIQHPETKPKLTVRYELINPKDGAYYFIYNGKKQLVKEGKYTAQYKYEGITYDQGDFYNSKTYFYKENGNLETIHYQEDGRNLKTEFFDRDKQLTKIRYFNKKTSDTDKIEVYKKGKLKETRIYKGFNTYNIVKAGE